MLTVSATISAVSTTLVSAMSLSSNTIANEVISSVSSSLEIISSRAKSTALAEVEKQISELQCPNLVASLESRHPQLMVTDDAAERWFHVEKLQPGFWIKGHEHGADVHVSGSIKRDGI